MKKRMNTSFFSLCFLASLMGEAYCIIRISDEYISAIGVGIVVLITGGLLIDSIASKWTESKNKAMLAIEKKYKEETDKLNEKYIELINIQKATYSVIKKDGAYMKEHLEEIASKVASLEESSLTSLNNIVELQKRAMEGQKNALNIEVNYNKENTKLLLRELQVISENTINLVNSGAKVDLMSETITEDQPKPLVITPLYDDPNKALTPEEIAKLFAAV